MDSPLHLQNGTMIQIECTKLLDATVHRHYVRVVIPQDSKICVHYFRDLIERELDIPVVCQVRLDVNGVPFDPLPPDFTDFPSRLFKPGEPIYISLDYYIAGADLQTIYSTINKFNTSISTDTTNHDLLTHSLDLLEVACFNVSWSSNEAVGARLCINSTGFLPKLYELFKITNSKLRQSLGDLDADKNTISQQNSANSIVSCYHTLAQALSNLMLMSARWEDKMLVCETNIPSVIRETLTICKVYFSMKHELHDKLQIIRNSLIYYCFSELQLLLSVRFVCVQFGLDLEFLEILRDSIIKWTCLSIPHTSKAICLFNLSGSSAVSRLLYSSDIYSQIIVHYLKKDLLTETDHRFYELYYRVCLTTLHMLKTPKLSVTSDEIVKDSATLLRNFLSHVSAGEIADMEKDSFCFGTLENYFSLIYLPSNSILGSLMASEETRVKHMTLIEDFISMGVLTIEVLMLLEAGRRVILSENLLPHLVIADWTIGQLQSKIKLHFPHVTHIPVPRLYDIAAIKAVYMGIGDYKEMMHYRFI